MSTSDIGNFESERGEDLFWSTLPAVTACVRSATTYIDILYARGECDPVLVASIDGMVAAVNEIVAMVDRGDLIHDWVVDALAQRLKANVVALRRHLQGGAVL